jgi:predicted Zn-dependent peptidase
MPAEIDQIGGADVRSFHQRWYVPKNAFVVVAGDTTPAQVTKAVEGAVSGWKGADPPVVSFTDPMPQESLKITLVHRPKAKQSDVYVGVLGPERQSKHWPDMAVANQVLGGGVSGRLFLDVREKQSLAYNTRSSLAELAKGPSPLIAYVGTQTPKTGLAVKAMLEHLERLGTTAPDGEEIDVATRFLSDVMAIRIETIGAVADEIVNLRTLGLPDDYLASYRKQLRDVTAATASKAAGEHVRTGHAVVVVAGDADRVGTMLSRFGEVKVVDPAKGFERIRSIPHAPSAPLEVPREAGE